MQAKIEGIRKLYILFILSAPTFGRSNPLKKRKQSAAKETPFMIKKDILSQHSIYKL